MKRLVSVLIVLLLVGCTEKKEVNNSSENVVTETSGSSIKQTEVKGNFQEGDTVFVNESCYLPDVNGETAKKMVLNGSVFLKDYEEENITDECDTAVQPQYFSWLKNCPQVNKIVVGKSGNSVMKSQEGVCGLYVQNGLLMYKGKSQGVYACPIPTEGKVEIPEGTKDIYSCAFQECEKIQSVSIPKTVRWVGNAAFGNNKNLKEILVSTDSPYLKSVNGVLFTKDGRVLLAYPAGKEDKKYKVPDGVRYIADGAFMGAGSLNKIELPKGIYSIGDYAFKDCIKLKEIICKGKVYHVKKSAYAYCDALPSTQWLESESSENVCLWENDYKDESLSYVEDSYPWKFSLEGYGCDDSKEIISILSDNYGKVPDKLSKKVLSLQHNYAKSEIYTMAVLADSLKDFDKEMNYFIKEYGR